jgi:hypothetical protein
MMRWTRGEDGTYTCKTCQQHKKHVLHCKDSCRYQELEKELAEIKGELVEMKEKYETYVIFYRYINLRSTFVNTFVHAFLLCRLSKEKECVVCFEERKKTKIFQCGHVACDGCSLSQIMCPTCRKPILTASDVFFG